MALYRLSVTTISRATGRTSTAAAAYRAGCVVRCALTGRTHDYRRKARGVVSAHLVGWTGSRDALWSGAELAERRRDAQVAREVQVALPHELPATVSAHLAHRFAAWLAERYGVAADCAIHAPARGDQRHRDGGHAHILTTTRRVSADGAFGPKVRALTHPRTSSREVEAMRAEWARLVNDALADAGLTVRVDHRSRARQGDRAESAHVGRAALALEQRTGQPTARGDRARRARGRNRVRRAAAAPRVSAHRPDPLHAAAVMTPPPAPRAAAPQSESARRALAVAAAVAQRPAPPPPTPRPAPQPAAPAPAPAPRAPRASRRGP